MVIENLQAHGGVLSLPLDLNQANDNVNKRRLMRLAEKTHTPATCRMIAMVLQPSWVWTKGDETLLKLMLDVGLMRGVQSHPACTT